MFRTTRISSARRSSHRLTVLAALSLAACALFPAHSDASTARVRWLSSNDPTITRYDVYVRNAGSTYATTPAWSGSPPPAANGALEALVTFAPSTAGTNYFAVVAVGGAVESPLSRELATGAPTPCRSDSCATKTSCNFGNLADGTSCDLGTGQDPCLAACFGGACTTAPGADAAAAEIQLHRLRFTTKRSTIKLTLKGKFPTGAAVDPASTGAIIELRTPDGAVVYSSSIAAPSFAAEASGRRFHYSASRGDPEPLANGVDRLDFRQNGSKWIVTARVKTPALVEASLEPTLSLVVRLGTTCLRRLDAACELASATALCR